MNQSLHQTITWLAERVLVEIPANLWDSRGRDAYNMEMTRWFNEQNQFKDKVSEMTEGERPTPEEIVAIWKECILVHKQANTTQWRQYVKNNGWYASGEDTSAQPAEGTQFQDFVTGGEMSGDTIMLDSTFGRITTSTDNILSFMAFQRDVLRATGEVYPKQYRKGHENNVTAWMKLVKRKAREDDEASLQWQLSRLIDRFLTDHASDPLTHESAIKNGKRAILKRDEFIFTKDTLFAWLKSHDRERRWERGNVLFILKEIYGSGFNPDKRIFNRRCYAIATDRVQVLNDGGGGEDDYAPQENPGTPSGGHTASEHLRDELQQGDGGRAEGTFEANASGAFGT